MLEIPDTPLMEGWLQDNHVEHYLCGECAGLHVSALESLEGVVNSRLFAQQGHLLFTTEVEVRPMAILPLASDLGRINMDYPSLKIFLDVADDATPQLVIAASMLSAAGIAPQQFSEFISNTIDGTGMLAAECLQLDYLFIEALPNRGDGSQALH